MPIRDPKKIDKLPIDLETYKLMEKIYKKKTSIDFIPSRPYDEYNFLRVLEKQKLNKTK